jgi:hypothetical protein
LWNCGVRDASKLKVGSSYSVLLHGESSSSSNSPQDPGIYDLRVVLHLTQGGPTYAGDEKNLNG